MQLSRTQLPNCGHPAAASAKLRRCTGLLSVQRFFYLGVRMPAGYLEVSSPAIGGQNTMNQSVGYAIGALTQLASHNPEVSVPCQLICNATGMPQRYLLQILGRLTSAGLVVSKRGVRGGYSLAKPANQIAIWDVQNAVNPEDLIDDRFSGFTAIAQRLLKDALSGIASDTQKRLSMMTIADLKAAKG